MPANPVTLTKINFQHLSIFPASPTAIADIRMYRENAFIMKIYYTICIVYAHSSGVY